MSKYLCTQYVSTHRSLDTVLKRCTREQRLELIGWIEDTNFCFLEKRFANTVLSDADYRRWLRFCEKWEKLGREPQDSFGGMLDNPKAIWKELGELKGGGSHA